MKLSTQVLVGALAPLAAAFPASVLEHASNDPATMARAMELLAKRDAADAQKLFEPIPIFDAEAQFIDISEGSGHEYTAPDLAGGDLRGPCPGLYVFEGSGCEGIITDLSCDRNAFANHGFLPHNGYATLTQIIDATTNVVGMGVILATFLAALGAAINGDGTSWSIGGTPGPGIGGPLSSLGNGLIGSHNRYESDASPTSMLLMFNKLRWRQC